MKTMKELLGTDDKKKQAELVELLVKAAASPVVDLLIRYENEQINLTIMGGDVHFDIIYKMLELTRQAIHQKEIEAAVQQNATNSEEKEEVEE